MEQDIQNTLVREVSTDHLGEMVMERIKPGIVRRTMPVFSALAKSPAICYYYKNITTLKGGAL